jgi:hypothetical protein
MGGGAAGPRVPPGLRGSLIGGVAGTASSRSIETLRYLPDLPGVVALGDSRAEGRAADPGGAQASRGRLRSRQTGGAKRTTLRDGAAGLVAAGSYSCTYTRSGCGGGGRSSPSPPSAQHGVQSGVQIERNHAQLRTTGTRATPSKLTQIMPIVPAGGRAVAGSNPVSPISEKARKPAGLFEVRRRGLEPPPGYPGPGPQPCHPGVRYVLCVHCVQIVRESGRIGRNGRSGCCRGCCHDRSRSSARGASALLPVLVHRVASGRLQGRSLVIRSGRGSTRFSGARSSSLAEASAIPRRTLAMTRREAFGSLASFGLLLQMEATATAAASVGCVHQLRQLARAHPVLA